VGGAEGGEVSQKKRPVLALKLVVCTLLTRAKTSCHSSAKHVAALWTFQEDCTVRVPPEF
jgi:hypothetical protein